MYKLYQHHSSEGSMAEVWVDEQAGLCKKYFKPDSITVSGRPPIFKDLPTIKKLFDNEIFWTTKLKSKYLLETYEYGNLKDVDGYYLIQEWVGPNLLHSYSQTDKLSAYLPDAVDQLINIFEFFQAHDVYKKNNAMSNMTMVDGKIKLFDFKYASYRDPKIRNIEMYSVITWLSKIDKSLISILPKYI